MRGESLNYGTVTPDAMELGFYSSTLLVQVACDVLVMLYRFLSTVNSPMTAFGTR
jgi:hypothetical protein